MRPWPPWMWKSRLSMARGNEIAIVPIAILARYLRMRLVERRPDLNACRNREPGILQAPQRSDPNPAPVPVIDDDDRRSLQGRQRDHDPIILILLGMRTIEQIDVEAAERRPAYLAKILLDEVERDRGGKDAVDIGEECRFGASPERPVVDAQGLDGVSVN